MEGQDRHEEAIAARRAGASGGSETTGVSFKIGLPAALYMAIATLAGFAYNPAFDIPGVSRLGLFLAGCAWLVAGLALLALSVKQLLEAMLDDALATEGPFAVVPNPMYAIAIVFLEPGIAVMTGYWPTLLAPVLTFALFRLYIREEEASLREKFGDAYEAYRKRVLINFL